MNLQDKNNKIKLLEKELQTQKDMIQTIPEVVKVLENFDGKVLNKRLETALKKVYGGFRLEREHSSIVITYNNFNNRSIQTEKYTQYIKNYSFQLVWLYKKGTDSDNRIIAKEFIEGVKLAKEPTLKSIERIESQLKEIDDILLRHKKIKDEIYLFNNDIDGTIKDYFDLYIKN